MNLILWRHAEAEIGDLNLPDQKRRLTANGEKQAGQIAQWLRKHLPRKRSILVSPAERTMQTAAALDLAYEIDPGLGTGASPADLLKISGWPHNDRTVVLIGHQPTLGRVASLLLGGTDSCWSIKKGGVWWFSSRTRNQETQTVLRAVVNPDFFQT